MLIQAFGHAVFVGLDAPRTTPYTGWLPSSTPPCRTWADWWVDGGENFIRLDRLEIIHTPPDWRERRDAQATALD